MGYWLGIMLVLLKEYSMVESMVSEGEALVVYYGSLSVGNVGGKFMFHH